MFTSSSTVVAILIAAIIAVTVIMALNYKYAKEEEKRQVIKKLANELIEEIGHLSREDNNAKLQKWIEKVSVYDERILNKKLPKIKSLLQKGDYDSLEREVKDLFRQWEEEYDIILPHVKFSRRNK